MNNKIFFKEQLLKILNENLATNFNISNSNFVIMPSYEGNESPKTNWDEIINSWVLPTNTNVKLTLDQVVETLVHSQGLFPLWVKIKQQSKDLILLNISRRFRKLNEIKEFHKDNTNMPFFFENSIDYEFTNELQKIGLTRKLLWNFELSDREKLFFENNQLTFNDIKFFFENHFKNYIYFPPDYIHRKTNSKNFSKLIIKKDLEFYVIENIETANKKNILITSDIDQVLETYLDKEMNYQIDNITINK